MNRPMVIAVVLSAVVGAACTSDATRTALPSGPAAVTDASQDHSTAEVQPTDHGTTRDTGSADTSGAGTPGSGSEPGATAGTTRSTNAVTTTTTTTTTTTPLRLVTQGAVVLVANASQVDGAAGRLTERLRQAGFTLQKATSSAGLETNLAISKVYVLPGSEAVARSVAAFLGGLPLAYMPTPVSIKGGPEMLGYATVVVMMGQDLAHG